MNSRLRDLQSTIDRLESSVQPLRKRIDELESVKATLEADLTATRLENSRWSGRYQKLLTQSDFIDPEIHRIACEERDALEQQKQTMESELADLRLKVSTLEEAGSGAEKRFEKMKSAAAHWKLRADALTKEVEAVQAQVDDLKKQAAVQQISTSTLAEKEQCQ